MMSFQNPCIKKKYTMTTPYVDALAIQNILNLKRYVFGCTGTNKNTKALKRINSIPHNNLIAPLQYIVNAVDITESVVDYDNCFLL